MIRQLKIVLMTLVALAILDGLVALALPRAPGALRTFFSYGLSVPGKLAQWQAHPGQRGDLSGVAWLPEALAVSHREFVAEDPAAGPVLRAYGMSFSEQLVDAARAADPALRADGHAGPGASPNYVHAAFLEDRANRRAGDVVLFAILSKSVPGLASFSNRVWAFEQPAPFTYPVFRPDGAGGLSRTDPVVLSRADQADPAKAAAFDAQLAREDGLWTRAAFAWPALDVSPFSRLLRRAWATRAIEAREAAVIARPEDGPMPWAEVLRRMVREMARIARADGQTPIVMLVQSRDAGSAELLATLGPMLRAEGIAYLATEDVALPTDARAYLGDGHFTPAVNKALAERLLAMPEMRAVLK